MDDWEMFKLHCQGAEHNEPFKRIKINPYEFPKSVTSFSDVCTGDYDSPIRLIAGEIQTEIDNQIYRAVQQVDIQVDKGELIKALQYDRQQYDKGYRVGYDKGFSGGVNYALGKIQEMVKGGDANDAHNPGFTFAQQ